MTVQQIIALARKHVGANPNMENIARLYLFDAVTYNDAADYPAAKRCALQSLAYSIGVFHRDYKKAQA